MWFVVVGDVYDASGGWIDGDGGVTEGVGDEGSDSDGAIGVDGGFDGDGIYWCWC